MTQTLFNSLLDHGLSAITPTVPAAAGGSFVSYDGQTISGTITGVTAHSWVDDATGLFHTATDLNAEWVSYYQQMIEGQGASLLPAQRLEAQAESVFLNTGLHTLSSAQQSTIREDVQREIDVIGGAMQIVHTQDGLSLTTPLTAQNYLTLNQIILNNPALQELGVQGHGLNQPPLSRYNGYTNDAQNVTDQTTYYVGKGPDHNEKAVEDFMDDAIMTHIVFPVVEKNGVLVQLNQNGNKEETLVAAAKVIDLTMYGPLLKAHDFSQTKGK